MRLGGHPRILKRCRWARCQWSRYRWTSASLEKRVAFVKEHIRNGYGFYLEPHLQRILREWPEWVAVAETSDEVRAFVEYLAEVVKRNMPEKHRTVLQQRCLSCAQPTQVEAAKALGISERTFRDREREGVSYLAFELVSLGRGKLMTEALGAFNARRLCNGSDTPPRKRGRPRRRA